MRCPNCQADAADGSAFCARCGAALAPPLPSPSAIPDVVNPGVAVHPPVPPPAAGPLITTQYGPGLVAGPLTQVPAPTPPPYPPPPPTVPRYGADYPGAAAIAGTDGRTSVGTALGSIIGMVGALASLPAAAIPVIVALPSAHLVITSGSLFGFGPWSIIPAVSLAVLAATAGIVVLTAPSRTGRALAAGALAALGAAIALNFLEGLVAWDASDTSIGAAVPVGVACGLVTLLGGLTAGISRGTRHIDTRG